MATINRYIMINYTLKMRNYRFISSFIVLTFINCLSPISALALENKFEESNYFNQILPSKILELNSNKFLELYRKDLISQQNRSANVNLNQATEYFVKAEVFILKALRDFKKGKRYLRSSTRSFNHGNHRILQTKIQSKRASKYFEESHENYIEALNYLRDALSSYKIFIEEIN